MTICLSGLWLYIYSPICNQLLCPAYSDAFLAEMTATITCPLDRTTWAIISQSMCINEFLPLMILLLGTQHTSCSFEDHCLSCSCCLAAVFYPLQFCDKMFSCCLICLNH